MRQPQKKITFKWHYLLALLLIPVGAVLYYLNTNYHESDYAKSFMVSSIGISVSTEPYIHFEPDKSNGKGIIFYPGGKVDPESYAPIMSTLAEKGYDCFIIRMPFNLAVFDSNAALDVLAEYDNIEDWYIAGHSLGGVMAANCVYLNPEKFDGIIFLASYPSEGKSLANLKDLKVLSLYGSNDGFVPIASQADHVKRLPPNSKMVEIIGGNHSQFGSYGFQTGDRTADITEEEQHLQIVTEIDNWIQY